MDKRAEGQMLTKEENDLLIRIDERTTNIWRAVESLEKHNREQNGFIKEALLMCNTHKAWIKVLKWGIGLGFPASIAFFICHLQGLI